ncbi:hypothetical protein J8273_1541 [Carpediemonas membranifera]|uniref:Uncharacterized protein n=1 Tax=Carpediemonas membranifera TaxID=201153 RepID=A0A8J6B273_9EUKA|nr:hypothetical protein J8273_7628 [Carpediemonas membranifera]KAG9391922.1 hypothetical protein J8273_6765 [Carpediemonas membranifera]KAG9396536.1 hypothetical protein J8273_1541 [Carpediemonas membranifera]|eukprot:KAG9391304.1 hypothetical protein J8273_7628 [Carpediemonas membranifera]
MADDEQDAASKLLQLEELVKTQAETIASLVESVEDVRTNAEDTRKPSKIPAVTKEFSHLRAIHAEIKTVLADPATTSIETIATKVNIIIERRLEFLRVLDDAGEDAARYFQVTAATENNPREFIKLAAKAKKAAPPQSFRHRQQIRKPFSRNRYFQRSPQRHFTASNASGNRNAAPGQQ